ncbi:MAG: S8 family serine peptidase [Actinomycetota bacterium]|nr:S8 family serine peptidase [Actinomycetota bacterium]
MHVFRRGAVIGAAALSVAGAGLVPVSATAASRPGPHGLSAAAITPSSTVTAPKSESGKIAQSDAALLKRTDAAPINVMVKLDVDGLAGYRGSLAGLAATSPSVTGKVLSGGRSSAEKAYLAHTAQVDSTFRRALVRAVPSAKAGTTLTTVYGGLSVRLPANRARTLLTLPGVVAVQADTLNKTNAIVESPQFIGAPAVWKDLGGRDLAGKGVIFADLDTGIWPEHPMLADNPDLGTPPGAPSGQARECDFGDNPLTAATDVFACNHKVIGGASKMATYNAAVGNELYPDTARDSGGHGTHTTTTAAGGYVRSAVDLGVDRGPISGVAPGAWVLEYKVCGVQGCFSSDSVAAVQQAVLDGATVINYSISGGSNPFSDAVELAFRDAYAAGVFVAASAGNSGPGAGTTDHRGPWVTTVAASTEQREYASTLTVRGGGASATFEGSTLTQGVSTPTPIVKAGDIPGYDTLCSTELPAGAADGRVVACQRGSIGRVQKGFNVKAGGAVGMILYNLPLADTETDNHFLPTVHLADGTAFLAFLAAHPNAKASWGAGEKRAGQGDVMAAFSSRGPGGQFLKPDITAPGVQILAGNTPTPDEVASGPSGQLYQAIAGTSMSAPHIAGSAILLKGLHHAWSPGAIKSAMMTTAAVDVVKEDLVTPADPFDYGAGRVALAKAGDAPIVFDESADNMAATGPSPLTAPDLNLPSINLPTMPGTVTVHRTATNLSGKAYDYTVKTNVPGGSSISVSPSSGRIGIGRSQTFTITVSSSAKAGQYFGALRWLSPGNVDVHVPVAFEKKQGGVTLAQSCQPAYLERGTNTTCTVSAENVTSTPVVVKATSTTDSGLKLLSGEGVRVVSGSKATTGKVTLAGVSDAKPAIASSSDTPGGGFVDLAGFGIAPVAVGDETNTNFPAPSYLFGGQAYTRIGVTSNGYALVGGSDSASDIDFQAQTLPDPTRPNGLLAPYWTDLNGTGKAGVRVATLTDGVTTWLVVQWDVALYGASTPAGDRSFQVWITTGATEASYFEYAAGTAGAGSAEPLTVGAENSSGTFGAQVGGVPTGSYVVTSTPGTPGGTLDYSLTLNGARAGRHFLTTDLTSDSVLGTTTESTRVVVTP